MQNTLEDIRELIENEREHNDLGVPFELQCSSSEMQRVLRFKGNELILLGARKKVNLSLQEY